MPESGRVFIVDPGGADILDFDPAVDRLDFGTHSVHNLILGKTPEGEVAIINPWAWTPQFQVLRGVTFQDLDLANFGIVDNEHLRQDIGGLLSWEQGIGPRAADTVYLRSHEYGVQERVEGFDPASMKLSFLYFGTRERLSVEDGPEGLLIRVEPTGQSVLLVGVTKAELIPANIEFHHDQIVEDQLEVPFGFTVEQVTMVSRAGLLTPEGPPGQITDGHQTSPGSGHVPGGTDGHDHGGHDHGGHDHGGHGHGPDHPDPDGQPVPGSQILITWAWGETRIFTDFDPAAHVLALDWFGADQLVLVEEQGSAVLRIPDMQQSYTLAGVSLAELSLANFSFKEGSAQAHIAAILAAAGNGEPHHPQPDPQPDPGHDPGHDHGPHHPDPDGQPVPGSQIVITWAWGETRTFADFDPAAHVLALDWFGADQLVLVEEQGSAVLRIPDMQQSYTLAGVSLAELSLANFSFKEGSAQAHIAAILTAAGSGEPHHPDPHPEPEPDPEPDPDPDPDTGPGPSPGADGQAHFVTWAWNEHRVIEGFDPAADRLDFDWFAPGQFTVSEEGGATVFRIPANQQSVTLAGLTLAELAIGNFSFRDPAAAAHMAQILAQAGSDPGGAPEPEPEPEPGPGHGPGEGGDPPPPIGGEGFEGFLSALGDFESGVDFARYQNGQISEAQIRQWVGDDIWSAWQAGEMEWRDMSYHSVNQLGFTGRYQFGEALLIDLGYYTAESFYGNGAAANQWNGSFTGKNGVTSYADFKSDVQETVIREAFGYNLKVIDAVLQYGGRSLDDFLGAEIPDAQAWPAARTDVITLTGLLASAHLVGAWGTAAFLLGGTALADENGTSMLRYMAEYGGYDHPPAEDLVQLYVDSMEGYGWVIYSDVAFAVPEAAAGLAFAAQEPAMGSDGPGSDTAAEADPGTGDPSEADGMAGSHHDVAA